MTELNSAELYQKADEGEKESVNSITTSSSLGEDMAALDRASKEPTHSLDLIEWEIDERESAICACNP